MKSPSSNHPFFTGIARFVCGVLLALLTIWLVGVFCCRNYVMIHYDPVLERNYFQGGQSILVTTEGWAITRMGNDGMVAPGGVGWNNPGGVWLLMGNSFVEGLNVNDPEKMHTVANGLLAARGRRERVVNVAMSAQALTDCRWQLPRYIKAHGDNINGVIICVTRSDILARSGGEWGCKVLETSDGYRVVPPAPRRDGRSGKIKHALAFNAFLKFGSQLKKVKLDFRLGPRRTVGRKAPETPITMEELERFVDWQFAAVRRSTDKPIVILWFSDMPRRGRAGWLPGEETAEYRLVRRCGERHGLKVFSMREDFNRFLETRGRYVPICGYSNTIPGVGHMNAHGHRVMGEKLAELIVSEAGGAGVK